MEPCSVRQHACEMLFSLAPSCSQPGCFGMRCSNIVEHAPDLCARSCLKFREHTPCRWHRHWQHVGRGGCLAIGQLAHHSDNILHHMEQEVDSGQWQCAINATAAHLTMSWAASGNGADAARQLTWAPGVRPVMVALGELAVMVTGGPPFTGVAVKVYCNAASHRGRP